MLTIYPYAYLDMSDFKGYLEGNELDSILRWVARTVANIPRTDFWTSATETHQRSRMGTTTEAEKIEMLNLGLFRAADYREVASRVDDHISHITPEEQLHRHDQQ